METPAIPFTGIGFPNIPSWRVQLVREAGRLQSADIAPRFGCAADIHAIVGKYMRGLPHEEFWVLACDVKNAVRGASMISRGLLDGSLVHPREVFRFALLSGAASIVMLHNHPSGDPEPSDEDTTLTKRLNEAALILGIPILDHLVIGARGFVSFSERGWL